MNRSGLHAAPAEVADGAAAPPLLPVVRAGFEGSGSPRWLMRTMQRHGFDRAQGFGLDLQLLSEARHRHGTLQALAERRVDVADADRQALAAAQADGLPLVAICPYGRILGSLLLHRDYRERGGHRLASLRGARLGVLSVHDKNWQLLSSACRELAGFTLANAVDVVHYPRRAELVAALAGGTIDAALLHWHLVPQLVADGHRVLAELPDLADALGAKHGHLAAPTTFFVMHRELAEAQPELVTRFIAATADAVGRLRDDEQAWHALAAESALDAKHLAALRSRWQERIGAFHPAPSESMHHRPRSNP